MPLPEQDSDSEDSSSESLNLSKNSPDGAFLPKIEFIYNDMPENLSYLSPPERVGKSNSEFDNLLDKLEDKLGSDLKIDMPASNKLEMLKAKSSQAKISLLR